MRISRSFSAVGFASLAMALGITGCSSAEEPKAVAPTAAAAYPLTVCAVSGEKLGSMGKPVVMMHEGREVQLCCHSCEPAFKKDPAKYVAMVDAAIKTGAVPATQPHGH